MDRLHGVLSALVASALTVLCAEPCLAEDPGSSAPEPELDLELEVLERGTRRPLIGIPVTLAEPGHDGVIVVETWTEADGTAQVVIPPGDYLVTIDEVGFLLYAEKRAFSASEQETIYLERDPSSGEYLYVTRAQTASTAATVEPDEMRETPTGRNDPLLSLGDRPEVARRAFGIGEVSFFGAPAPDTAHYIDGLPVPAVMHLGGIRTVVPLSVVDRVELDSGVAHPRYGDYLAGVVDLKTRPIDREGHTGTAAVDFVETQVRAEGPIGDDGGYRIAARRSYMELFVAPFSEIVGGAADLRVPPNYWDYQARIEWHPSRTQELDLDVIGFGSAGFFVGQGLAASSNEWGHRIALRHRVRKRHWRNSFALSVTPYRLDYVDGESLFDRRRTDLHIANELDLRLSDRLRATLGALVNIARVTEVSSLDSFPLDLVTQSREVQENIAGYVSLAYQLSDDLTVELGTRAHTHEAAPATVDASARLRYRPIDEIRVEGALGTTANPPSRQSKDLLRLFESYVYRSLGSDPDWMRATHAEVHVELEPFESLPLTVNFGLFAVAVSNLVATHYVADFRPPVSRETATFAGRRGSEERLGATLAVDLARTDWLSASLAYTTTRAQTRLSPDRDAFRARGEERHALHLGARFFLPDRWRISASFLLSDGTPVVPRSAERFGLADLVRFQEFASTDLFHRLDLRVDKTWVFDLWRLGFYLDVENAYYHRNIEAVDIDEFGRVTEVPGLPILPSFGVTAEY